MEKPNVSNDKKQPSSGGGANKITAGAPAKTATTPAVPVKTDVPPPTHIKPPGLFRTVDWAALIVTFVFVFVAYYLTIAPEMTLEDSGELATGSFLRRHPPPAGLPGVDGLHAFVDIDSDWQRGVARGAWRAVSPARWLLDCWR